MKPRERVLKALAHEQPDRVPIDLGSTGNTGITIDAYESLKRYLKIDLPAQKRSKFALLATMDEPVLERLRVDFRGIGTGAPDDWQEKILTNNRYIDEWGVTYYKPSASPYCDAVDSPLYDNFSAKTLREYKWPDPDNRGRVRHIGQRVKELRRNTDYAIVLHVVGGFITISQAIRGFENWLADTVLQSELLEELLDRTLDFQLKLALNAIEAAESDIDIIHFGDDIGMQSGLMYSPETYRSLLKPRQAKLFAAVKAHTGAKILFHSCGSNFDILEDLIEIGVDAFNPVQTDAKNMEPERLKSAFGNRLAFWGGIDTHSVLPFGNVEDVRKEAQKKIEIFARGGGYVFNPVHNIQPEVPPENICAAFDAAFEYGRYQ